MKWWRSSQARSFTRPGSIALVTVFIWLIYLWLAWFTLPPEAVWSPDEGAKLLQLFNIRSQDGVLVFDISYSGRDLDPSLNYAQAEHPKDLLRVVDGALEFERLPIFPFLSLLFFRGLGFRGLYLLPTLFGALIGPFALELLEEKERNLGMWFLIAFGSPVMIYSLIFWEHTMAVCLVLVGAGLILSALRIKLVSGWVYLAEWVIGALLFGVSAYLRLESILFVIPFFGACWLLVRDARKRVLLAVFTFVLVLVPYPILHQILFQGNSLPANARYLNLPLGYLRSAGWQAIPDLLVGPAEDEAINSGSLGFLWAASAVAAAVITLIQSRQRDHLSKYIQILKYLLLGLFTILGGYFLFTSTPYRAAHGLLFTTPWALTAVLRAPDIWRQNEPRARIILLAAMSGLCLYIMMILGFRASSPQGGLEWGARFAMVFYPILALFAAWDWRALAVFDRVFLILLILLGVGFQARGLTTIHRDKEFNLSLNQMVASLPEEHILTDLWWFALDLAPKNSGKAVYTVAGSQEAADWVEAADQQEINAFVLVTLDHTLPMDLAVHRQANQIRIMELKQAGNLLIYRFALP